VTRSIGGQIAIGLGVAGVLSAIVLFVVVGNEYGFFSSSLSPTEWTWTEVMHHVVIPLAVFLVLFGVGAFIAIRLVSHHVEVATREAIAAAARLERYDAGKSHLPAEIEPFAKALSELSAKLETHARRQEAFAMDAAHELKTPLAVLALELDKLPSDDAARLRRQINAMSEMVEQFLLLARSQSTDSLAKQPPMDLQAVARRVTAELAPSAFAQGKSVAFQSSSKTTVKVPGLEEAIAAAVRTLAVNAIRATPTGGEVIVEIGSGPTISVFDGGKGIDAKTLECLKARGVRADRSPGTAGLGLAIADRIAEAHGAELQTCMPERPGVRLSFATVNS
jgi:two-component system OmpR family sensor kinase